MHFLIFIIVILLIVWFMFPAQKNQQKLATEELYRNEPSRIQMDNAEFKFYT
jgi:hypothetical protein